MLCGRRLQLSACSLPTAWIFFLLLSLAVVLSWPRRSVPRVPLLFRPPQCQSHLQVSCGCVCRPLCGAGHVGATERVLWEETRRSGFSDPRQAGFVIRTLLVSAWRSRRLGPPRGRHALGSELPRASARPELPRAPARPEVISASARPEVISASARSEPNKSRASVRPVVRWRLCTARIPLVPPCGRFSPSTSTRLTFSGPSARSRTHLPPQGHGSLSPLLGAQGLEFKGPHSVALREFFFFFFPLFVSACLLVCLFCVVVVSFVPFLLFISISILLIISTY